MLTIHNYTGLLRYTPVYSRKAFPALTLPARPALCSAEAFDTGIITRDSEIQWNQFSRYIHTWCRNTFTEIKTGRIE